MYMKKRQKKGRQRIEAVKIWTWRAFSLLLLLAIGIGIFQDDWFPVAVGSIAFIIIIMPSILEKALDIEFPSEFEIAFLMFMYASLYLGEIQSYYIKFWWWDLLLHSISGVMLGALGFIMIYILNDTKKTSLKLSPLFLSLFAFSFSITLGVLWEIFEFSVDSTLGFNMQKSGLVDTMWDLIVNTLGALLTAYVGYWYMMKHRRPMQGFEKLIRKYF